jgi:riboflavin kinase/FMN adenylyltransferase
VLTFSVHPDLVVHGKSPDLLLSLDHRLRELERAGIDATLVLPFDAKLRELSAEQFVEQILVGSLAVRGLVLGHDTAVGKDRRGDAKRLDELGAQHGFEVHSVGEIAIDGVVVSSTRIRQALQQGDLETASKLLGRAPSVVGVVVPGDARGRELGFPTANLDVESDCRPKDGVYATLVLHGSERHAGLCNIGRRPTFDRGEQRHVEVHLLDFHGDLYGQRLEVVFVQRLRDERKFAGAAELVAQIRADRTEAEEVFRRTRP